MTKSQNKMWGGRFTAGPDAIMEAINASIAFDQRLAAQDIQGSRAHAAMLGAVGIISDSDCVAIREGLDTILLEMENGKFPFRVEFEDIHMNVEARLAELIGEALGVCIRVAVAMTKLQLIFVCGYATKQMLLFRALRRLCLHSWLKLS